MVSAGPLKIRFFIHRRVANRKSENKPPKIRRCSLLYANFKYMNLPIHHCTEMSMQIAFWICVTFRKLRYMRTISYISTLCLPTFSNALHSFLTLWPFLFFPLFSFLSLPYIPIFQLYFYFHSMVYHRVFFSSFVPPFSAPYTLMSCLTSFLLSFFSPFFIYFLPYLFSSSLLSIFYFLPSVSSFSSCFFSFFSLSHLSHYCLPLSSFFPSVFSPYAFL